MKKKSAAGDSATIRRAVRLLFESHSKFEVVGEAEHGCEAIEKAATPRPDLVILDLSMPVMRGSTTSDETRTQNWADLIDGPRWS